MNDEEVKEAIDLLKMSMRHIKNPTLLKAVENFLAKIETNE